jgi:hypothetical protein
MEKTTHIQNKYLKIKITLNLLLTYTAIKIKIPQICNKLKTKTQKK